MFGEYFSIVIFLGFAICLSYVIFVLPKFLVKFKYKKDKLSPYECGFEPEGDARIKFDVRFYLVAILFIVFDLEVAFLIPWSISLGKIGWVGLWSMMFFFIILIIGFIYEWKKGALEWE
jgi:NADH-quinone oxidoreductase subunit A